MNKIEAGIVGAAGFILTMGGVGGIELSETSDQMLSAALLAILGLLAMYCSILAMKIRNWE